MVEFLAPNENQNKVRKDRTDKDEITSVYQALISYECYIR